MKKIYAVVQGSYSDYHICALFDNKPLADKFILAFGNQRWDEMKIEEYILNPVKMELNKNYRPFFVRMCKNGDVGECRLDDSSYGFLDEETYGFCMQKNLYNHCFARNTKHAIKITNELRTQLIANNKWIN